MAALNGPGLDKLESALKETARLAPGTLIVYSRVVQRDHVLPDGTQLRKGQFVTVSGPGRAMDPAIYGDDADQYRALRFCEPDKLQEHRAKPFSSVDTDILTWGAGRWACPGRMVADMAAKILLVKLLDEFDFAFVGNEPVKPSAIHEFLFFHPDNKMLLRRRDDAVGIVF
jgi:cytochrome P450